MPLLQFYHPPGAFTAAEKQTLASNICTKAYSRLPAFYVNVHFIELDPSNHFIGGVSRNNFIRIVIEHLAVHTPVPETRGEKISIKENIEKVIKPFVADKGFDWEWAVIFGQQHLWSMNGIDPPLVGEDDIDVWRKEGKPMPRS